MQWIFPVPRGRIVIESQAPSMFALTKIQDRAEHLTPLLNGIAGVLRRSFAAQFAAGGEPAWQPLAASTIAAKLSGGLPARTKKGNIPWRLKQGGAFGPANILIATGALRDSYVQKGARGHVETIDEKDGTVDVGSRFTTSDGKPLAFWHQRGTEPYVIRPKNKKALAFTGSTGETILRRVVHHPGLAARPIRIRPADRAVIYQMCRDHLAGISLGY